MNGARLLAFLAFLFALLAFLGCKPKARFWGDEPSGEVSEGSSFDMVIPYQPDEPAALPCYPLPPPGWQGPALTQWRPLDAEHEACPDGTEPAFEAFSHPSDPPLACSSCSCSSPPGQCDFPPGSVRAESIPQTWDPLASCSPEVLGGPPVEIPLHGLFDGQCHNVGPYYASSGYAGEFRFWRIHADPIAAVPSGACEAFGGERLSPASTWTTHVRACSALPREGACGAAELALPVSPGWGACVSTEGAAECPAEYPIPYTAGETIQDERACAPCGCDTVPGQCSAMLLFWPTADCSGLHGNSPVYVGPNASGPVCEVYSTGGGSGALIRSARLDGNQMSGAPSCSAAPMGEPSGDVVITERKTICCRGN